MSRALARQTAAEYEKSFVGEAIAAIEAWQVSCNTDRGPGIYRPMTEEKVNSINTAYRNAATNMYRGFDSAMKKTPLGPLWNSIIARTATAEVRKINAADKPAHFVPSDKDLANRETPTMADITVSPPDPGGGIAVLNDGKMNDQGENLANNAGAYLPAEGDRVTIELDTDADKNGHDVSKIVIYSASDTDRITQNYDIDVMQVGSTEWVPLFTGYDLGRDAQAIFEKDGSGRELKITIRENTGKPLCTNVCRVRFTFHETNGVGSDGNPKTAYREIDLVGISN